MSPERSRAPVTQVPIREVSPVGMPPAVVSSRRSERNVLKKIGGVIVWPAEKIVGGLVKRSDNALQERLKHPKENEKEIKRELKIAVSNAVGRHPVVEFLRKAKRIAQVPGFLIDHFSFLPIPLPHQIAPTIPIIIPVLATTLPWLFAAGLPILFTSAIVAGVFNLPNALEAFSEGRIKKGLYELVLTPLSLFIPIGLLDNSFWQETGFFKRLENRKNKQVVTHLDKAIVSADAKKSEEKRVYDAYLEEVIDWRYARRLRRIRGNGADPYEFVYKDLERREKEDTQEILDLQQRDQWISQIKAKVKKDVNFGKDKIPLHNLHLQLGRVLTFIGAFPHRALLKALEVYDSAERNRLQHQVETIKILQHVAASKMQTQNK